MTVTTTTPQVASYAVAGAVAGRSMPLVEDMAAMSSWFDSGHYVADPRRQEQLFDPAPTAADRLYVSRRTVETHVSRAFRKTGVSSRTALATLMARRRTGSRFGDARAEQD